jgi:hypothetical protein
MVFAASQLMLMIGGCVPTRYWWSFDAERQQLAA